MGMHRKNKAPWITVRTATGEVSPDQNQPWFKARVRRDRRRWAIAKVSRRRNRK